MKYCFVNEAIVGTESVLICAENPDKLYFDRICIQLVISSQKKVKQSHYRLRQALRFPGVWGSQISKQSAHEGGKIVSPTHRPPLPQETCLVLISVSGWVNPRAIVRLEGLCQWKISMTASGIERATYRLTAQWLTYMYVLFSHELWLTSYTLHVYSELSSTPQKLMVTALVHPN